MRTSITAGIVALVFLSIGGASASHQSCNSGFTGNGTYCEDINECDYINCTTNATCYNTNGSYVCACDPGFSGYGEYYCYALSPCYTNPCGENAYCRESGGSYTCLCRYTYTWNGSACISLCSEDCGTNAYCTPIYTQNTTEYVCRCSYTYTWNGSACISLCSEDCGTNAYCTSIYTQNTTEYVCQCRYGYTGDATGICEDIDECVTGQYCQVEYGYCKNTDGSYTCTCVKGYYYSNIVNECFEFDSDEPYRVDPLVVPGCNEAANAYYRRYLEYQVVALVRENFRVASQYESGDGSGNDDGSGY